MGEAFAPDLSPTLAKQLGQALGPGRLCECGRTCRRGKATCWFCDPDVPAELKQRARQMNKRKALPPGVSDPSFLTTEDRQAFREAVAGAVLRDELSPELAGVALRAADGATREAERANAAPPQRPIVVDMDRPAARVNGAEAGS